ncbi:unnamed protein product [Linum trigynum]|uniref:Uncharacterized protein n=1 Tax=Linum trigynum TaxID=586398 RepID=A0AAV2DBV3_9ROSI
MGYDSSIGIRAIVLDLAAIHALAQSTRETSETDEATCTRLAVTCDRMMTLCYYWGLNHDCATIINGDRSDNDVARIDANEISVAKEIKIFVNEIGGKETLHKGDNHLCRWTSFLVAAEKLWGC